MVMALAFQTKDPDRVKDALNIFLFHDLYPLAGSEAFLITRKWDTILRCGTLTSFADMSLMMGKQKVAPIAGWDKADSQLEARWTTTVNTPSQKTSWGKDMGLSPPIRQSLGGTSTLLPTCYAFPLDNNRRWWLHWWPYPGRRTLPHCKNGASSWGCCSLSLQPSPD